MLDQALAVTPPTGQPMCFDGLVETPSSMLFLSREGFRRHIPMTSRVTRARRGIARAVETASVFHLWMHVEDLVPDPETMLAALGSVLGDARRRADVGELEIRTMAGFGGKTWSIHPSPTTSSPPQGLFSSSLTRSGTSGRTHSRGHTQSTLVSSRDFTSA